MKTLHKENSIKGALRVGPYTLENNSVGDLLQAELKENTGTYVILLEVY